MYKSTVVAVYTLVAVLWCGHGAMAATMFTATLSGDQEAPVVESTASGTATLTLSDDETSLTINMRVFGLDIDGTLTPNNPDDDVTISHIHAAPVGVSGTVVFGFIGPNSDLDGDLVITPEVDGFSLFGVWDGSEGNNTNLAQQLDNLKNGNLYLNVHSEIHRSGEIRGQIIPEPASLAMLCGGVVLTAMGRCRRLA